MNLQAAGTYRDTPLPGLVTAPLPRRWRGLHLQHPEPDRGHSGLVVAQLQAADEGIAGLFGGVLHAGQLDIGQGGKPPFAVLPLDGPHPTPGAYLRSLTPGFVPYFLEGLLPLPNLVLRPGLSGGADGGHG